MIVSAPMRTSTSITVDAGAMIVTPARMCASRMRCWAIRRTRASSTRSLTPSRSEWSSTAMRARRARRRRGAPRARRAGTARPGRCRSRRGRATSTRPSPRNAKTPVLTSAIASSSVGRVARALRLDDALHPAVGVADDAAVPARVLERHRDDRRRGAGGAVGVDERAQRRRGDERRIAVEDEHGRVAVDLVRGREQRTAGPVRLGLHREHDAVRQAPVERAVGRADDDDLRGAGLERGGDGPVDHRPAADVVEHLRRARAHARSLAGRQDHDGGGGHGTQVRGRPGHRIRRFAATCGPRCRSRRSGARRRRSRGRRSRARAGRRAGV